MKKHIPWFPFYADAFAAKTNHLADDQLGKLLKLRLLAWQHPICRIPQEKEWITKKLKITDKAFEKSWRPILEEFFKKQGKFWIDEELLESKRYAHRKSLLARNAANQRYNKDNEENNRIKSAMPDGDIQKIQQANIHEKQNEHPAKQARVFHHHGSIEFLLDDADRMKLAEMAPGWDKHSLFRSYEKFIATKEPATNPKGAFFGWIKSYTKGKPP